MVLLVTALGGVVLWQNDYDMKTERLTIRQGGHVLHAVLSTPVESGERHPLVVMIHGDAAVDATHEDGYLPMWETYARAGYATLSWAKPGVDGAPGNWLDQSMDDRADEAAAAIAWARARPDLDAGRIGLWGVSQAGWVLPKIAKRTSVAFVMAVSPAINWLRQGRYNLLAELKDRDASPATVRRELDERDRVLGLLKRRASYQEYVRVMGGAQGMSPNRWIFIGKNFTSDATDDLLALRGTPVLLALAGHDRNVDTTDTEAVYREQLESGGKLTVRHYPDADHSMVKDALARSELKSTLVFLFAPRSVFAHRYLDDQNRFLRGLRP
ncbi:alpha/beta hydrolase [Actinomadura rubrisoli]|uniref:Alpha/beta hydrolase n=2 Tax=Actinomadura rubrisoli TaxID=2530368 RepID=A0A4R5AA44_9ACTN|nr:alpha/beta hydrolase [Actinomadura rubrisoli]